MKFGGTSVADPDAINRLIGIVRQQQAKTGSAPVVVVSALAGVTDKLVGVAQLAEDGASDAAAAEVQALLERHLSVAAAVTSTSRASVLADVRRELDELNGMVHALSVLREVSPRSRDAVHAVGEVVSSRIVAAAFADHGIASSWIDARTVLVTDAEHTSAAPDMMETCERARERIAPLLADGKVVVLGGFIGATAAGITSTLGRGGSDYSAAIFGSCLDADEIQIWTDVDGMLTADPRIVPKPSLVAQLSFAEASELAYFGAKVLHPKTIQPAMTRGIPVRILNSWRPDGAGTLITAQNETQGTRLTGLASKKDVTVIDITSTRMLMAYGFLRRVFEVFERFRTAVDMVTTSEVSVSVTVDDRRNLDAIVQALSEFSEVSIEGDLALLCAVGDSLQGAPEIAARVVGVLEEVPLKMISQAASRRNITVVLRQSDLPHAMQRLHEEFFA